MKRNPINRKSSILNLNRETLRGLTGGSSTAQVSPPGPPPTGIECDETYIRTRP